MDDPIGELLADADDESLHSNRSRTLSVFKNHEDAALDYSVELYREKIESLRRFKIVPGFVAKGVSFQSVSRFINIAPEVTMLGYLIGCREGM